MNCHWAGGVWFLIINHKHNMGTQVEGLVWAIKNGALIRMTPSHWLVMTLTALSGQLYNSKMVTGSQAPKAYLCLIWADPTEKLMQHKLLIKVNTEYGRKLSEHPVHHSTSIHGLRQTNKNNPWRPHTTTHNTPQRSCGCHGWSVYACIVEGF